MVTCHFRHITRTVYGHVHASAEYGGLRRPQRARVHHANRESNRIIAELLYLYASNLLISGSQYFNAVLYASAPEMFNTSYRASASGMLSCLGRIAGIVAPIAGQRFIAEGTSSILWLGAGGIWVSALFMCFLPIEMRTRQMF